MSKLLNLDGVITELKKDLDRKSACLEAWRAVEFPTKKDGTPFAVFSKNIKGASVRASAYANQPGENELHVTAFTKLSGYVGDVIPLYNQVKYLKDPAMIAKKDNYLPKQSYLEQLYKYDIEDTRTAVAQRIAYLEDYTRQLAEQIEDARKVWDQFVADYTKAMHGLQDATEKWTHKDLYYYVRDTVKDRYPYV